MLLTNLCCRQRQHLVAGSIIPWSDCWIGWLQRRWQLCRGSCAWNEAFQALFRGWYRPLDPFAAAVPFSKGENLIKWKSVQHMPSRKGMEKQVWKLPPFSSKVVRHVPRKFRPSISCFIFASHKFVSNCDFIFFFVWRNLLLRRFFQVQRLVKYPTTLEVSPPQGFFKQHSHSVSFGEAGLSMKLWSARWGWKRLMLR